MFVEELILLGVSNEIPIRHTLCLFSLVHVQVAESGTEPGTHTRACCMFLTRASTSQGQKLSLSPLGAPRP